MGQLWQLDAIDVRDRDEAWREVIDTTHLPWTLDRREDQPPQAGTWVQRRRLGDLDLLDCRCAPCAGERRPSDLVRTDGEYIGVLLVTEGVELLSQSDHEVVLGAGDIVAWDSVRPVRFAVLEPLRMQTLLIPRPRFQQMLPEPELVTARGIPPRRPPASCRRIWRR